MEQERFKRKEPESQDYSRHKSRFDSDDDKPQKSQTRKVDGEEKYDQIYSISSSYGKFEKVFVSLRNSSIDVRAFLSRSSSLLFRSFRRSSAGQKEVSFQWSERANCECPCDSCWNARTEKAGWRNCSHVDSSRPSIGDEWWEEKEPKAQLFVIVFNDFIVSKSPQET